MKLNELLKDYADTSRLTISVIDNRKMLCQCFCISKPKAFVQCARFYSRVSRLPVLKIKQNPNGTTEIDLKGVVYYW